MTPDDKQVEEKITEILFFNWDKKTDSNTDSNKEVISKLANLVTQARISERGLVMEEIGVLEFEVDHNAAIKHGRNMLRQELREKSLKRLKELKE